MTAKTRAFMIIMAVWSLPAFGQKKRKADVRPAQLEKPAESKGGGLFFPDWSPESFAFEFGPILGARARRTNFQGVEYDTVSSEIGLGARLRAIPLVPGNPGVTLEPYGTYTFGSRSEKQKSSTLDQTDSSGFQRYWYGLLGRFYFKFFRYSLDFGLGEVGYDKSLFLDVKAQRMMNDLGFMILPFLSAHYTLTSSSVTEGENSKPSIEEIDHWLHSRIAFSFLHFSLDLGPGFSSTEYSGVIEAQNSFQKIATVDSSYFKALALMNPFWKLWISGEAKYVYEADAVNESTSSFEQLPYESLNEAHSLSYLPKGSIEASAFFGLRKIISGFGIGWQLYYLELNHDSEESQISRDQGMVLTFDATL